MKRLRSHRARRVPALIASLALFLVGSNYCVLVALTGGAPMACLTIGSDAVSAAVPACHRGAATEDHDSGAPTSRPSCCPDPVVAPAAPVVEKSDLALTPLADAVLAAVVTPASPTAIVPHGASPAHDGQPPPGLARAPVPARAPPLA